MSSLSVGRGLEGLELWLAGLFSAAELAAADLLLQLSADKGVDGDEAAALSATESTSPRSATPGCGSEDLTVDEEEEEEEAKLEAQEVEEEEKRFVEKPAASTELDRRARKRYRRLSDLYAATSPVTSASTDAKKKRKRNHHRRNNDGLRSPSYSSSEATRYGGDYTSIVERETTTSSPSFVVAFV